MTPITLRPQILAFYKPKGLSSGQFLGRTKKILGKTQGKIGHFGTLDPFAEGLFLVGIAGGAKLNDYVHQELTKTYQAVGLLGVKTDSGDETGKVVDKQTVEFDHRDQTQLIAQTLNRFQGEYWQSPPAFSAAKFEGRPLYAYARQGIQIHKDQKKRWIHRLEILEFSPPLISFRAEVSSGTYIRTLFEDIAKDWGTVGHLRSLNRLAIGSLNCQNPLVIRNLLDQSGPDLLEHGLDPRQLLCAQTFVLSDEQKRNICFGKRVHLGRLMNSKKPFWLEGQKGELLGLGMGEGLELKTLINYACPPYQDSY